MITQLKPDSYSVEIVILSYKYENLVPPFIAVSEELNILSYFK